MAGGHYLFLGSYLALFVLYVHISEGRTHIDIGSDEYKQITSASRQPVSREKRGIGLTSTGFGVMATGLISLLSLSLSPDLRRRVTNIEQLARVGAPAWSRRDRVKLRPRPQRQGPVLAQCVYRLGERCVYSVPVRKHRL